ncbi:PREDICTED: uncharacterized protein LOC102010999 [Chinchilla lanigera]|uniref:uncharacterized protein LOC102010999 n=1 Tax=Chinchilla lanigera TaxID=34839 RepID=UPI00038F0CA8|nr:PREDICTED: uncharacterized protein LOC102010999 [Chinchilla lanigera]
MSSAPARPRRDLRSPRMSPAGPGAPLGPESYTGTKRAGNRDARRERGRGRGARGRHWHPHRGGDRNRGNWAELRAATRVRAQRSSQAQTARAPASHTQGWRFNFVYHATRVLALTATEARGGNLPPQADPSLLLRPQGCSPRATASPQILASRRRFGIRGAAVPLKSSAPQFAQAVNSVSLQDRFSPSSQFSCLLEKPLRLDLALVKNGSLVAPSLSVAGLGRAGWAQYGTGRGCHSLGARTARSRTLHGWGRCSPRLALDPNTEGRIWRCGKAGVAVPFQN